MVKRPLWWTLALVAVTMGLGVALRFGHFGQPAFVRKYGGSATWALEIYWVVSAMARWPGRAAIVSGVIGTAVEFLKLVHTPGLESFRGTLAGVLLLGRFFSWWDILAYWVAVGFGFAVDLCLLRGWFARRA